MWAVRPRYAIFAIMIVAAIVGGLGYSLAHSQARARRHQEADFTHRAQLAARLTAGALASGDGKAAVAQSFSGGAPTLAAAMRSWESSGTVDQEAGLLDARGHVLASWPVGSNAAFAASYPRGVVATALRRSVSIYSDVIRFGPRKRALVWLITPFHTPSGNRALASLTSAAPLATFAEPYLSSAPAVESARAYLIDGHGLELGSSAGLAQGMPLPDRALSAAALSGRSAGRLGDTYWAAAPVGGGTDWRVVFVVPYSRLVAAVESGNGVAWLLFAGFVLAILALVGVGARAIRSSGQLAAAREREQAARRLAYERLHDPLTALPNRALFLDRTETALARAAQTGRSVAVIFTDVDHFKRINDSLGPDAGDELLVALAGRLSDAVRPQDTVSRFGGDEFLILCDELDGEDDALRLAARISDGTPFDVGDRSVHVTCCAGVAIHSQGTQHLDAAALVREADAAMYSAKAAGPGHLRVFDAELHDEALRRLDIEVALRGAFARAELFVHYQPIVALPEGRVVGVEALVRWNRPGEGIVLPGEFIGLAEECGLIADIGRLVLHTAVQDVEAWDEAGLLPDGFVVSVNVSPRQLADPEFPDEVAELLASWPLDPGTLCLEITESAVATEPEAGENAIARLHELGVKLAIDDFGVGLSSLQQLLNSIRFDLIKLDRSFVAAMGNRRERAVVAAIASAVGSLGLVAVAEGVERLEQADQLTALGYILAQGFYFARPTTADAIRQKLLEASHSQAPAQR